MTSAATLWDRQCGRSSRRRPHSLVQWSWLHATAYASAVVASFVYMHNELTLYFQTLEAHATRHQLVYSIATAATIGTEQLDGLHRMLAAMASRLRYLLVIFSLMVWIGTLVLSRRYRLHSPIRRVTHHLGTMLDQLRDWTSKQRKRRIALWKTSRHPHDSHRRTRSRSDSWNESELEVDENDLLIVSSLSSEPRHLSSSSSSSSEEEQCTDRDVDRANGMRQGGEARATDRILPSTTRTVLTGKIVLHPREGARGGRHQTNQIISDDPYVSRFHFQIQYDPMEKEYYLQDLGSTTGTYVFLKPDTPKRLHVDDRVKLGDTEFEVLAIDENITTGMPFLHIRFTEGPLVGICQTIGKTSVTLGRHSSNALCITEDDSISSRHSVISYLETAFYITDLDSTNGTAIRLSGSGKKSRRRYLRHGDVFGVGSNRFLVEYSHQVTAPRR